MLECPLPTLRYGDRGSIYMNALRDKFRGCVLVPASSSVPVDTAARSGNGNGISASIVIESPQDSWMEVFSLIGLNTAGTAADITTRQCVNITDYISGQRRFTQRPVNVSHVFGTQKNPFFLDDPYSEPILMPPQSVLKFDFINPSTSGEMSFSFALEARRISESALAEAAVKQGIDELTVRRKKVYPIWIPLTTNVGTGPFGLGVPGVTIPAGGQIDAQFSSFDNAPAKLMITRILGSAISAGVSGDTTELFTMDLYDGRTYRKLNNQPIAFNCGAGPATFPFNLKTPIIIASNQVVKARFYNLVTDETTDVFITLQVVAVE